MQIRHSLAKWEFWVWAHTWISTWIPGSHWAELGREERGEGIVMAITHWVLTKCPACNTFSLPGALLTFATPWNVGKIIRTLHIIQIELREGSDLLKITEGSDSFKASGAWDQARLTSGGWVLSEEERDREERFRLLGPTKHKGPELLDAMSLDIQVGCMHRPWSPPALGTHYALCLEYSPCR